MIKINVEVHVGETVIPSGSVVTIDFTSKRLRSKNDGSASVTGYFVEFGIYHSSSHQQYKDNCDILIKTDEIPRNYVAPLTKIEFNTLNNLNATTILLDHFESILGLNTCEIIDPES